MSALQSSASSSRLLLRSSILQASQSRAGQLVIASRSRAVSLESRSATSLNGSRCFGSLSKSNGRSSLSLGVRSGLNNRPWNRSNPSVGLRNGQQVRTMFIQTESTPNDSSLKFIPGVTVMPNSGTYEILSARESLVSPLAVKLMGVEGVTSIFFGPDFVTVSKDESQPWNLLKPEIFAILMEHFTSGKPLFNRDPETGESSIEGLGEGPQDTKILDTDSEVVAMIKELLDTRVRPAIQEDGGDIEYKGFDEDSGIVKLKLKGSCRGCSSSSVTLKSGIERMLQHYVPEVHSVEQVLDEEELIALDEFAKLEKRLEAKKSEGDSRDSGMAQYMSV